MNAKSASMNASGGDLLSQEPTSTVNIQTGCIHDCRYCFGKAMAIHFGHATPESWSTPVLRPAMLCKKFNKRKGTITFPSSHDIVPGNLDAYITVLKRLLAPGNRVRILTKGHPVCIREICSQVSTYKAQVTFRFKIKSADNTVLKYWEPGAPSFEERLAALEYARSQGFMNGVDCDPMLDAYADEVIVRVRPFITESILLGMPDKLPSEVATNCPGDAIAQERVQELISALSADHVRRLYRRFGSDRKIQWSKSMKIMLEPSEL